MARRSRIYYRIVDAYEVDAHEVSCFWTLKKAMAYFRRMAADAKGTDSHDAYVLQREAAYTAWTPTTMWEIRSGKVYRLWARCFKKWSRMDRRAAKRNQRLTYKGQPYFGEAVDAGDVPF